ncbi:MAG: type I-E CRISPR-associated protein Cse2/CasB [Pseudomonas sp.]
MKAQRRYLDDAQHSWLRQWWRALQPREEGAVNLPGELLAMGRADRARLKRCSGLDDLLLESATHRLAGRLLTLEANKQWPRFSSVDYTPLALLAGALAQVTDDQANGASLAAQLGGAKPGETAPMSELRFRRLQQVRGIDDFYRQLVRALQLAKRKVDLAALAEDVLAWSLEQGHTSVAPSDGLKFRWARDYYLSAPDRASK